MPMSLQEKRLEAERDYYAAKATLVRQWEEIYRPEMTAQDLLQALANRSPEQHQENERAAQQAANAADRILELRDAF